MGLALVEISISICHCHLWMVWVWRATQAAAASKRTAQLSSKLQECLGGLYKPPPVGTLMVSLQRSSTQQIHSNQATLSKKPKSHPQPNQSSCLPGTLIPFVLPILVRDQPSGGCVSTLMSSCTHGTWDYRTLEHQADESSKQQLPDLLLLRRLQRLQLRLLQRECTISLVSRPSTG